MRTVTATASFAERPGKFISGGVAKDLQHSISFLPATILIDYLKLLK
jgi:hypothetical protein